MYILNSLYLSFLCNSCSWLHFIFFIFEVLSLLPPSNCIHLCHLMVCLYIPFSVSFVCLFMAYPLFSMFPCFHFHSCLDYKSIVVVGYRLLSLCVCLIYSNLLRVTLHPWGFNYHFLPSSYGPATTHPFVEYNCPCCIFLLWM